MPTRCNRWYLLQILLVAQHVSGTIMPIIRSSRVLYRWSLPVVFGALVFKLSVWCGAESYVSGLQATAAPNTTGSDHTYNTLELLMMGIMVPEKYWASNKICNKYRLLHLVGILFPHISLQTFRPLLALGAVLSSPCVACPMCIATKCSWSFVYWVIILECIIVTSYVLFYYVGTAVLHNLDAGLLARSQYP